MEGGGEGGEKRKRKGGGEKNVKVGLLGSSVFHTLFFPNKGKEERGEEKKKGEKRRGIGVVSTRCSFISFFIR